MKKLIEERAITLIALVVTIVVLWIFAGVTINLAVGQNGLISKAKEAREKMRNAEANETKPYMSGDVAIYKKWKGI